MKTRFSSLLVGAFLLLAVIGRADTIRIGGLHGANPFQTDTEYVVLLALSGGGARGLASVGVLQALEERGIRFAAIAGTSIGGIIGGLYASGYSPNELADIVKGFDFETFFTNAPARRTMLLTRRQEQERHLLSIRFEGLRPVIPQALTAGQRLMAELTNLTTKANYRSRGDFGRLPIPFATVCTDIVSGREVILKRGSLAEALRATMAFPIAFTGLEKGNQLLMDGGMVTPIPVDLVRTMCDTVSFVVAINATSPLMSRDKLVTPVDIANQVTSIMTADKLEAQLANADYIIKPSLNGLESADFKHHDSLIAIGYECGSRAADSIIELLGKMPKSTTYEIRTLHSNWNRRPEALGKLEHDLTGKRMSRSDLITRLKRFVAEESLFQLEANLTSLESSDNHAQNLELIAYDNLLTDKISVEFVGVSMIDESVLRERFLDGRDIIDSEQFQRGLDRILNAYSVQGYDITDIDTAMIDFESGRITIHIDEAIVQSVDVLDNERTKGWLVRTYFPIKKGEPFSTDRAARGIDNIYGTDLFDLVTFDLVSHNEGSVVKIRVKEKNYAQLRLGWHWSEEFESEEFVEILDDNVLGMGLEYLLHAQYATDRQRYFGRLKMDRIWHTYLTARVRVYHDRLDRQLFDNDGLESGRRNEERTGFEIGLGQQIARFGLVSGALTFEEVRNRQEPVDVAEDFGQRILRLESVVETFDRAHFPNEGKKHLIEIRYAGKLGGGDVEYTRFFSSIEAYVPLSSRLNYHPRITIGISRSGLPPSEQFYLGGSHSLVGFRKYQLSGDKTILFNNELRLQLPLGLYLTGRYDFGEVYSHIDQIKLRNLRHGVGAFLALDSPLGPIELGYGIADGDVDRFYLNIGLEF